MIPYEPSL